MFLVWFGGESHEQHKVIQNSLDMRFVRIPKGEFFMGSGESDADLQKIFPRISKERIEQLSDERPRHKVIFSRDIFMGETEVTVGQFAKFLNESSYVPESIRDGSGGYGFDRNYDRARSDDEDAFRGRNIMYSWKNLGFPQSDIHPVANVTWNDAMAMATWLSEKEHVTYRLPTEAEWEYACTSGQNSRYPNTNFPEQINLSANTFDASASSNWFRWKDHAGKNDSYPFTSPVRSYEANAFGLYDMSGNVWEWVSDNYDENYYHHSELIDPKGIDQESVKVRRGGSWHTWAFYARCSFRNYNSASSRYPLVGFRLVRETSRKHPI